MQIKVGSNVISKDGRIAGEVKHIGSVIEIEGFGGMVRHFSLDEFGRNFVEYLGTDECLKRYPRLCRCMQSVAILSCNEAAGGIRDFRTREILGGFSGEAVQHYGGPKRCIRKAIEWRHTTRQHDGGKFRTPEQSNRMGE